MVKLRKYLSLLLLVVYVASTGGAAYASLSCRCIRTVRTHAGCTAGCAHHEGGCCAHHAQCDDARDCEIALMQQHGGLQAPCCGNHHSTEITLYTPGDDERSLRLDLGTADAPARHIEFPAPRTSAATDKTSARRGPFLCGGYLQSAGLRAPPVLV